jgi:hypothetical protein
LRGIGVDDDHADRLRLNAILQRQVSNRSHEPRDPRCPANLLDYPPATVKKACSGVSTVVPI